jgi:hypothetical protein
VLRVAESQRFFRIFVLSLLSVFIVACADVADVPEFPEPAQPTTPPNVKDEELAQLHQLFVGSYGCQSSPELSILNYDPQQALEEASCDGSTVTDGDNPVQLFELSEGLHRYLDVEVDAEMRKEFLVFANKGALFKIDINNNTARRLTAWNGEICRIIPKTRYERVLDSGTNTETWHELDAALIYAEVVFDTSSSNACSDESVFRSYFQIGMNYDEDADDVDVCDTETDGKSTAADCKTKLRPIVSEAQALSQVVTAYVPDESTESDLTDEKLVYGYLGWGRDENDQKSLKLWDENDTLLWSQVRSLESFDEVSGIDGAYPHLFTVDALDGTHYLLQLGRDVFTFQGRELFGTVDTTTLFSDRVYQMEEVAGSASKLRFVNDDDDLVIFDSGKFFHLDYKAGAVIPNPSKIYSFVSRLESAVKETRDEFEFSQFQLTDCQYAADVAACTAANDIGGTSWQATTECEVGLGCSLPVDLNDYCVTPAERVPNTPAEDLCTPSRYQDLNELNDASNDAEFTAYLQYYLDNMRDLDFQMYENKLLLNMRLTERDALLLYDFNQAVTVPASVRENLLLGERLVQAISRPIINGSDLFITSNIVGLKSSNVCYKGFQEVECNLAKLEEGTSDECTDFDINAGTCREGKYRYESRALYCSNADVTNGDCIDTNQINPQTLQVESTTQDAKWLPVVSIDSVNGLQKDVRVLVSADRQFSSNNPTFSYTKEEGVLGNPELYMLSGTRTLSSVPEGQLQGSIESLPDALVLRDGEGEVSVTAEEFLNGTAIRQQDELYVNENLDALVRVTGSQQSQ